MTSERRLREAAAERLSLVSGGEVECADQTQVSVVSVEATPKQAKAKIRVRKKSASNEEHVEEQTDEALTKPKAAPEDIIKEKTHGSVGNLLSLFDSPATTTAPSDPSASLERILNP